MSVELVDVNLMSKDPKPEGFLAANPNGKVPAFVDDDGFTLFESRAINGYLCSRRPDRDLFPADPKRRARVEQWSYWHAIHLAPPMLALAFERVLKQKFKMGAPDEATIAAKLKDIDKLLPILNSGLSDKDWLVDQLSLADFAVASTFPLRGPSGLSLSTLPHIERWLARVEALPSWQKSLPKF